jgi:hypothetical protein
VQSVEEQAPSSSAVTNGAKTQARSRAAKNRMLDRRKSKLYSVNWRRDFEIRPALLRFKERQKFDDESEFMDGQPKEFYY